MWGTWERYNFMELNWQSSERAYFNLLHAATLQKFCSSLQTLQSRRKFMSYTKMTLINWMRWKIFACNDSPSTLNKLQGSKLNSQLCMPHTISQIDSLGSISIIAKLFIHVKLSLRKKELAPHISSFYSVSNFHGKYVNMCMNVERLIWLYGNITVLREAEME